MINQQQWEHLHHYTNKACPCTGLAVKGDDTLVTIGEDGGINILNIEQRQPVKTIGKMMCTYLC